MGSLISAHGTFTFQLFVACYISIACQTDFGHSEIMKQLLHIHMLTVDVQCEAKNRSVTATWLLTAQDSSQRLKQINTIEMERSSVWTEAVMTTSAHYMYS